MLNTVALIGRLVEDPKTQQSKTNAENKVYSISLAVSASKDETHFFECHGLNLKALDFAHKGDRVGVSGRLIQRRYTAKDGTNRSVVEVFVERVELIESKPKDVAEAPVK